MEVTRSRRFSSEYPLRVSWTWFSFIAWGKAATVHEVSVMLGMIEVVAGAAPPGQRVSVVHVRVGALSGVSTTALDFAFQVASGGTVVEGARFEIETVPVRLRCEPCDQVVVGTPRSMACPRCGTPSLVVVSGRELDIAWIEVNDSDVAGQPAAAVAGGEEQSCHRA